MRINLDTKAGVNIDFFDGFVFRVMQEALRDGGPEKFGYTYYKTRVENLIGGLAEYDAQIAGYIIDNFKGRKIVHAGIGAGTLTSFLAVRGFRIAGIESYTPVLGLTQAVRDAAISVWPSVEANYELLQGRYPAVLADSKWVDAGSVLAFTNVGAGWSDELVTEIISTFSSFGDVVLDLRNFGRFLATDAERDALFERVGKMAKSARRLPVVNGTPFAHFTFG